MFTASGIGRKEKEYFIENFVMLCEAGMDCASALDCITEELHSKSMKKIGEQLKQDIGNGMPLARALENSHLFNAHVIALIRIGEASGQLTRNLRAIAIQQRKERSFQSKLRAALLYPAFIFCVSLIVGISIAWFILPRLALVFTQLHIPLPPLTRFFIDAGLILHTYGIILVPLGIGSMCILLWLAFFYPPTKHTTASLMLSLPAIGPIIRDLELGRISYILGSLLEAGVPIVDALTALCEATSLQAYENFTHSLKLSVERGLSFHQSFTHYPHSKRLVPMAIQQMVIIGERSGRLAETFLRVSELYEEKNEETSKNIAVLLEPILLVFVWLGVVGIALAVILPLYTLIGGLNT